MKVFCTYFDHHYLPRGLALHGSLREHCPEFQLWVLCLTPECHAALTQLALPEVRLITLEQLEQFEPQLTEAKKNRTAIEYFFTCTPVLPLFAFESEPATDAVTYVDGDMLVFHPLDEVWNEIAGSSIAIVAHRFPQALKALEQWGIFNVGWLTFRRDANARTCLEWWRDQCLEWCYDRLEDGKFADQKYLDDWPERFPGVKVISHPGVNLAPWNLGGHQLALENDRITVDGRPLLIFHFHGLKQRARSLFDPQLLRYSVQADPFLTEKIYAPYLRKLTVLAGKAGLRKEDVGLNLRGTSGSDPAQELSLRHKWLECDRLRHEPGFGGFMAAFPVSVGVVLTTSKEAPLSPEHLASITPWLDLVDEIVVVDCNSPDGTLETVRNRLPHPRLRMLSLTGGLGEAWNLGVAHIGSDFTYIPRVGDTITRDGMKQMLEAAFQCACDIVLSPPARSPGSHRAAAETSLPAETLLGEAGAMNPIRIRRCRMMAYAAQLALNGRPRPAIGSMFGTLYRTEMLQAMPFIDGFGWPCETIWGLQNLQAASVALVPSRCSASPPHLGVPASERGSNTEQDLSQIRQLINHSLDEALSQTSASDREDLLRVRELVFTMSSVMELRRLHSVMTSRLDSLRSSLPTRALWVLDPRAWRARRKRERARKQLLVAEAAELKLLSLMA